jgi:hypothetical protein
MRTHSQKWLIENALFSCCIDGCKEEQSFHPDQLAIAPDGNIICESCWGDETAGKEDAPSWRELTKFHPFGDEEFQAFEKGHAAGYALGRSLGFEDNRDEKFEQNGI